MSQATEQAVQIEANKNAISTHERVCAERYARIDEKLEAGNRRFDAIEQRFAKRIIRIERLLYAIGIGVLVNPSVSTEFIKKAMGL